jgi:hypothetical protein
MSDPKWKIKKIIRAEKKPKNRGFQRKVLVKWADYAKQT